MSEIMYAQFFKGMFEESARNEVTIYLEQLRRSVSESADFVAERMPSATAFADRFEILRDALKRTSVDGLFLEFGVYKGSTINVVAETKPSQTIHGFDSFEGLPESWGIWKKGQFAMKGLPKVRSNVRLTKGWFDQTLPKFLDENRGPCAFVHVDSDMYSSAKTVFDLLKNRIVSGTIIVFDEYLAYPGWHNGEHKAFMEFIQASKRNFRYLGYCPRGQQVSVEIGEIRMSNSLEPSALVNPEQNAQLKAKANQRV